MRPIETKLVSYSKCWYHTNLEAKIRNKGHQSTLVFSVMHIYGQLIGPHEEWLKAPDSYDVDNYEGPQ